MHAAFTAVSTVRWDSILTKAVSEPYEMWVVLYAQTFGRFSRALFFDAETDTSVPVD